MNGLNKVILLGNLGRDAEMKTFPDGGCVASFSIATSESYKKDEKWETITEWHNVKIKGKNAAFCDLQKGETVLVEGKIKAEKWIGKDGTEKSKTIIECFGFTRISKRDVNAKQESESQFFVPEKQEQKAQSREIPFGETEDNVPF